MVKAKHAKVTVLNKYTNLKKIYCLAEGLLYGEA